MSSAKTLSGIKLYPTFSQSSTRANLVSGENLTTSLGKIMKWYNSLNDIAWSGKLGQSLIMNNGVHDQTIIRCYDDGEASTQYGSNVVIGGFGNTIIGSGESISSVYLDITTSIDENTYVTSDSSIYLYANCGTYDEKLGLVLTNLGNFRPLEPNTCNLGTSTYKFGSTFCDYFYGLTLNSSLSSSSHITANRGNVIINSTNTGGTYTMLNKMNSFNGVFTQGVHQQRYILNYTSNDVINAGTNSVTYRVDLLDENGDSKFVGKVSSRYFEGNVRSLSWNGTSSAVFGLPFTNTTVGETGLYLNNGLNVVMKSGTTSDSGVAQIRLGNNIAEGTAGNERGAVAIFSLSEYHTNVLAADNLTANTSIKLPATSGILCLEGHSHDAATTSTSGFMTAAQVTKLNGIANNANDYSLPTASASVLGGVKVGTGLSIASGVLSNSGVRSVVTGTVNGTIEVNTNGTSTDVAVKGLGTAAYTASTAYATASHTHATSKVTTYNPTNYTTLSLPLMNYTNQATGTINDRTLYGNNAFSATTREGTTSDAGVAQLILGNNASTGTDGNKYGMLRLFGKGSTFVDISCLDTITTNYGVRLPAASGTLSTVQENDDKYIPIVGSSIISGYTHRIIDAGWYRIYQIHTSGLPGFTFNLNISRSWGNNSPESYQLGVIGIGSGVDLRIIQAYWANRLITKIRFLAKGNNVQYVDIYCNASLGNTITSNIHGWTPPGGTNVYKITPIDFTVSEIPDGYIAREFTITDGTATEEMSGYMSAEDKVTLANKADSNNAWLLSGGTAIVADTDLNNLIAPGNYYCETQIVSQTLVNAPFDVPFILKTFYGIGTGYVNQEAQKYRDGTISVRYKNASNVWSAWRRTDVSEDERTTWNDRYTKAETDTKLALKLDKTANAVSTQANITSTLFRPMIIGARSSATEAGLTNTATATANIYFNNTIYCQPSTGVVYANHFKTNTQELLYESASAQHGAESVEVTGLFTKYSDVLINFDTWQLAVSESSNYRNLSFTIHAPLSYIKSLGTSNSYKTGIGYVESVNGNGTNSFVTLQYVNDNTLRITAGTTNYTLGIIRIFSL